ncbi:MAG: hypothetical protein AAGF95_31265 [Chloroflexota bacterium]
MSQHDKPIQQLVQVLTTAIDEQNCQIYLDTLEDYISLQLAGEDYQTQLPAVAMHLDSCVSCAEAYALLYEARVAETPQPVSIPTPDLSFLPTTSADSAGTSLQELLQGSLERVGTTLRFLFSQQLLDTLTNTPSAEPTLAFREQTEPPSLIDLVVEKPSRGVASIQITAYANTQDVTMCTLRVQVALTGRDWPDLADVSVRVLIDNEQHQTKTDPWGEALFEQIPIDRLPHLQVEVDPGDTTPTTT